MNRLKILAIAYACNPTKGSEFAVGWGWVRAIATDHDVTVITADFNANDIELFLKSHNEVAKESLRFLYVRNRPWHYRPYGTWRKIEESFAKPVMNLAYQDWLGYGFREAEKELAQNSYDLVHLITYVGWRFPGNFYQLGIPFVWGPIGGTRNTPWRLLPILGLRGALYYGARNLINSLQLRILSGPRRAMHVSGKGLIAATSEIRDDLSVHFGMTSRVICEVGPPDFTVAVPKQRRQAEPFRICWSGQHLPGKALQLLLRAAACLPQDADFSVEILGDGPCKARWKSLAVQLGIENRCRWHGWLPRSEALAVMRNSHVFAITSLKDLTSTVAVEAISLGLPVVSLDHCGFADLVTEECGIKITPQSQPQIVRELADALRTLYRDEPLRSRLAEGAIRRSRAYAWEAKLKSINDIYYVTIAQRRLTGLKAAKAANQLQS